MHSFEKFDKTLPGKNKFYGSLSGKGISDKEYQHVLKVWNNFKLRFSCGKKVKEVALKGEKVSNYFVHDCLKVSLLLISSLKMY